MASQKWKEEITKPNSQIGGQIGGINLRTMLWRLLNQLKIFKNITEEQKQKATETGARIRGYGCTRSGHRPIRLWSRTTRSPIENFKAMETSETIGFSLQATANTKYAGSHELDVNFQKQEANEFYDKLELLMGWRPCSWGDCRLARRDTNGRSGGGAGREHLVRTFILLRTRCGGGSRLQYGDTLLKHTPLASSRAKSQPKSSNTSLTNASVLDAAFSVLKTG